MKSNIKTLFLIAFICLGIMSTPTFAQFIEDTSENDYSPPCAFPRSEWVCNANDKDECTLLTICYDLPANKGSGAGILSTCNGVTCPSISGRTGDVNDIWIGSVLECDVSGHWTNSGQFGYCKNGVCQKCTTVTDPLEVKGAQYSDVLGAVPEEWGYGCGCEYNEDSCTSGDKAIGPWSLLSDYDGTRLKLYGCDHYDQLWGSKNADLLIGGSLYDQLAGYAGDDTLCGDKIPSTPCSLTGKCAYSDTGSSGDDVILGGTGGDSIYGGGSSDTIYGNEGNDTIKGGDGSDAIAGNDGADSIEGEYHDDLIVGGLGCDTVKGNSGDDTIYLWKTDATVTDQCSSDSFNAAYGGQDSDIIYGAKDAKNHMWGGDGPGAPVEELGDDYIEGNNSADWLCGEGGVYDELYGGDGSDIVADCFYDTLANGPNYCDETIYGEEGVDYVCYLDSGSASFGANAMFCVSGGDPNNGDECWCDEEDNCAMTGCEGGTATESECTSSGAFDCCEH